ncbi:sulfite exporter TauE/SafE family protein [Kordiimonas pumila]|uniref:Probable membrane transporter protein n=1 Tax=Kordiimonas pumila TaxID=2161677 RepID=A0ABV7D6U3_9PROT|nr:sulfite exporter TauE/SafE family protein [Kordiimonas pumila]
MNQILADFSIGAIAGMTIAIFFAAILRAFTGFGFALAALPVLSLFFLPGTSVSLVTLLTLIVSVATIRSYWGLASLKPIGVMLVFSAVGTMIGVYVLTLISADTFRLVLGITVMLACLLLAKFKPHEARKEGGPNAWGAGLLSGVLNGAIAIPGPPAIIYAMAVFPEASKSRAFLMVFFLFSAAFATLGFTYEGLIGTRELILTALSLPALLAGDKLGSFLFKKYGSATYRKIGLIALFIIGIVAVIGATT